MRNISILIFSVLFLVSSGTFASQDLDSKALDQDMNSLKFQCKRHPIPLWIFAAKIKLVYQTINNQQYVMIDIPSGQYETNAYLKIDTEQSKFMAYLLSQKNFINKDISLCLEDSEGIRVVPNKFHLKFIGFQTND